MSSRQSVGWFQNDFAGRIANRMMQTAPAVGEATFQTFDAMVYAVDLPRRRALAAVGHRLAARRCRWWSGSGSTSGSWPGRSRGSGRASKDFSDARSAITGRIVDSYTNIQSVKLFAHTRTEEAYAGEAIEHARKTFMAQMRIITLMDLGLTADQRLPDRRGHRLGAGALDAGRGDDRHGRRGLGAGAAAERDDRLDHVVAVLAVPEPRGDPRGAWRRSRSRSSCRRCADAQRAGGEQGRDRARPGQPPLRARLRAACATSA